MAVWLRETRCYVQRCALPIASPYITHLRIDHFHNDVTQSALLARLFLLAKGVRVIHCVEEKGAVGVVPVRCCAVNCTNRFKRD